MKINYKTSMFIVVVVVLLVVLFCARYLATENSNISNALATLQSEFNLINDELNLTKNELMTTNESLQNEVAKSTELNELLIATNSELEASNIIITDLKSEEYRLVHIGDFKLTHYCPGFHGEPCGTGDGLTATGTKVTPGRTIAVDPKVIPYGVEVYIEGYGWRVAEDCGGSIKGNHIDVAMGSHDEAMSSGVKHGGVWILVKNET
jgi:3D (Asp-Asp-Asp) domain-containing protein